MITRAFPLALVLLLAASGSAEQTAPAAKPAAPASKSDAAADEAVIEPKAIELLKAASSRLAAARSMTFTAVVTYESPSRIRPRPRSTRRGPTVTLQRPDKLRVITPGDGPASEFYYDGKTMTAFAPAENLVAVADAPATIDAALEAAYDTAAIYFPFTDVIVADPYDELADGLQRRLLHRPVRRRRRHHDGHGRRSSTTGCSQQIWIGADDKLPRRVRAVFRDDPLAAAPPDRLRELGARPRRAGGRVRVAARGGRDADRVRRARAGSPAGRRASFRGRAIRTQVKRCTP